MSSVSLAIGEHELVLTRTKSDRHRNKTENAALIQQAGIVARKLPRWSWLAPLAVVSLVFLASGPVMSLFVGKYAWTGKDFQEVVGPSVLGCAIIVNLFFVALKFTFCRMWLLAIPSVLLCRELHFAGAGAGVYVGLIGLMILASQFFTRLQPVWNCRNLLGCLFAAACCYVVAVMVDRGVWKFLPHSNLWNVNLEETLESCGHLMILAASLCGATIADYLHCSDNSTIPSEAAP